MRLFLALVFLVAVEAASLGEGERCRGGPSMWCGSLRNASSCNAFSYCLKKVWEPRSIRVQQTEECQITQKLVKTVRRVIAKEKGLVTGEATYLIGSICTFIHDDNMRKECKDLVTDFLPQIKKLMDSSMEPASVATVMGLCQLQENNVEETLTDKGTDMDKEKAGDTVECDLCELLVGSVDQYLSQNTTEATVQHFLEDICQKLPSQITPQCLSFIDEYAAMVWKMLLEDELDPRQVCLTFQLCKPTTVFVQKERVPAIFCTVCEVLVGILEVQLSENTTEADIEKALDKACSYLPFNLSTACVSVIKIYLPAIIDLLEQEMPPAEICLKIHLCNATAPVALSKANTMEKRPADPMKCDLCKSIITEINSLLGDNRSEQAIIHVVEKVCDVVQGDLRLQCKSEVENYGPAVLDLLRHMDDPAHVCTYLQLCASTSAASPPYRSLVTSKNFLHPFQDVQMMVGSEVCTRGPSFWCATVENARKCGMEEECIKYGLKP